VDDGLNLEATRLLEAGRVRQGPEPASGEHRVDVAAFDFELPPELIALRPVEPRDAARLLVIDGAARADKTFIDLPNLLHPGDLLVLNDTRVIHARLRGTRRARLDGQPPVEIEILLNHRVSPESWEAFARPAKRLRDGDMLEFGNGLMGRVQNRGEDGLVTLQFDRGGAALDEAVDQAGEMPLPPYIASKRKADARDAQDYQTTFAEVAGSVAAPTAGLHFTPKLFRLLQARGLDGVTVTLHVGGGTFMPVRTADIAQHVMHPEWGRISADAADAINSTRAAGGRIVAVGTTSLRLLESAADEQGIIRPFEGDTRLFITPGYAFKTADILITNFHLPRSTLYMLVQAFGGVEAVRAAYAHAIAERYRFYSYGDGCLIRRAQ
jgi:S-adenosylmethionine:tRNA ribosyltransferase-isomerase